MKVLKIILYVLLTLFAVIALFINISPQFGSNPSRSQKQFFSSFKNFENGEFKNNEPTALFTDEMSFWDFFKTDLNSCLLYTSPSPRDLSTSRMPSSA